MKYEVSPLLTMAATSGGDLKSEPLILMVAILEPPMTVSLLLSRYCDSSVLPSSTVSFPVGVPAAAGLAGMASGLEAGEGASAPPGCCTRAWDIIYFAFLVSRTTVDSIRGRAGIAAWGRGAAVSSCHSSRK